MASVNIKIEVDDSEVTQKLKNTTDKVESLGNVTQKVSREIREALAGLKGVKDFDTAFAKIDELSTKNQQAIQELTQKINELNEAKKNAFEKGNDKAFASYQRQGEELERLLNTRIKLQSEIASTADALNREEQQLKSNTDKQISFRAEMMKAMNDYRQMALAMRRGEAIDPEKFEQAKNKLIEMRKAVAGVTGEMGILASTTPTISGLIAAAQGVTGAFSVAQGVIGLFNAKSEDMQKIMMRVQSLMAIMMGLQQVQNTLLKKNAILQVTVGKLKQWWVGIVKQATAAEVAETAATTAQTAATTGLAGAFRILGLAIKSVPVLGWLITGVTAVVGVISSLTKGLRERAEDIKKINEESISGAAESVLKIDDLTKSWRRLSTEAEKKKWLIDNKKEFESLGVAINDVTTAENIFSSDEQIAKFKKAEEAKAKISAARTIMVEALTEQMKAQQELETANLILGYEGDNSLINRAKPQAWIDRFFARRRLDSANARLANAEAIRDRAAREAEGIFASLGITPTTSTTKGGKESQKKTAEEIAKEYNEYLNKVNEQIAQSEQKRQRERAKMWVDSMKEGLSKELQKIEQAEIDGRISIESWREQREKEGFNALRKMYKDLYNEEYGGEMFDTDSDKWVALVENWSETVGKKINEEAAELNTQLDERTQKLRDAAFQKEAENMLKGLTMREEYEKQKLEITRKYEKQIAAALANGDKERADRLSKQGKNEVDELTYKYNKENAELFRSATNRSRASLVEQLSKLRERLRTLQDTKGSLEDIKNIQEQMDEVQDALDEKEEARAKNINEIINAYAKALGMQQKANRIAEQAQEAWDRGDKRDYERLKEREKRLRSAATALTEGLGSKWQMAITAVVEGFQIAANYAKQIADITGDSSLTNWAEQANALAQNLNAAWQGYQSSGSWIGAVAGGLSDMLSQTINARLEAKAWVTEFNRAIKNFRNSIELAAVTFDSDKFRDMFGVRSLESATEAYKKMNEAQQKYNEKVTAAFNLGDREKHFNNLGDAIFQGHSFVQSVLGAGPLTGLLKSAFGFGQKTTQKWYSELDAYTRGLNQLQAMQIKVKHASGWAKFWGGQDKYKSLYDVAPELWDENGEFDVENAQRFLQVNKQLTDEQRDQIQNAIDLKKAYEDAKQALEDVISETVGSFADDMANAVWEAITTGANAWEVFKDKGNEALVALGKQMLKEFAISTYLEQFKDKLRDAYGSGDMSTLANVYTEIFNGIPMVLENMTIAGENWVRMLREHGYDITTTGATSGSTGGYTTQMSHEDASEINGRMTDIQMQMRLVSGNVMQIVALQQESRGFARMQSDYLYDIRRYTSTLPTIAEYSKKIATNTANL